MAAAARSRGPAASLHLKTSQVGESSRRASLLLFPLTPAASMAQGGRIGRRPGAAAAPVTPPLFRVEGRKGKGGFALSPLPFPLISKETPSF